jgi:hypothetical protein
MADRKLRGGAVERIPDRTRDRQDTPTVCVLSVPRPTVCWDGHQRDTRDILSLTFSGARPMLPARAETKNAAGLGRCRGGEGIRPVLRIDPCDLAAFHNLLARYHNF